MPYFIYQNVPSILLPKMYQACHSQNVPGLQLPKCSKHATTKMFQACYYQNIPSMLLPKYSKHATTKGRKRNISMRYKNIKDAKSGTSMKYQKSY